MKEKHVFTIRIALALFGLVATALLAEAAFAAEVYHWYPGDQCKVYDPAKATTMTPTAYGPRNDDPNAQWWYCPTGDNYWYQQALGAGNGFFCGAVGWAPPDAHLLGATQVQNFDAGHRATDSKISATYTGTTYRYEFLVVGGDGDTVYGFNDNAARKVFWIRVPPEGYVYAYGCQAY